MPTLTERQGVLLQLLSEMTDPITNAALADLLGVSPRTVRYDIARVNRLTNAPLIEAARGGHLLNLPEYRRLVKRLASVDRAGDDRERILLAMVNGFDGDLFELAQQQMMSDATVRTLIRELNEQLAERNLRIASVCGVLRLEGTEFDRRRLMGDLLSAALSDPHGVAGRVASVLPDVDLERVRRVVEHNLQLMRPAVGDMDLWNLSMNAAICLQRYESPLEGAVAGEPTGPEAVRVSERLVDELAIEFPTRLLGRNDRHYMGVLLNALVGTRQAPGELRDVAVGPDLEYIVGEAIRDAVSHFNLKVDMERLQSALTGHVRRLLGRSGKIVYFRNSLRESLRTRSPVLYDVAVFLAHRLSTALRLEISDDEIGLLVIYIGLYIEDDDSELREVRAVVVCPEYQTLRDWILANLAAVFSNRLHIVEIVSSAAEVPLVDVDLILITTGETSSSADAVQISALLSDIDIERIGKGIDAVVRSRLRSRIEAGIESFLSPELFFRDLEFASARETILNLCGHLQEAGVVPGGFTQSVLLRESYSSTVFAQRFAVPHAMEFMASETKIAILIPKKPIDWGEDSRVSMVLLLAIKNDDYESFVAFYQAFIRALYDPDVFSRLRAAEGYVEFCRVLVDGLPARLGD